MYTNEREVARKAEQMLETALRNKTGGFKSHITGNGKSALKDAEVKAKVKKYGLVKNGTARYYMRKLSIKMERHGFIQHYGVNTLREGTKRTRQKPRITTYNFETHHMNLKPTPFIDSAIESSGVVPFVLREVTRLRAVEVMVGIKQFMEQKF